MPWREISRGLNLYLPKDEREGKEARRLKPRRNLWHVASTSSEIVVELHIEMETNEWMNARTNKRTHDGKHGWFLFFCIFCYVCCFMDERANERSNERTNTWRITCVVLLFVFLLFVVFCVVLLFFSSNHKCANRSQRHQPMACWSPPTEGMNERPKECTNEQMNIEAWLEQNRKICRQVGPTPKTPFYLSFGALGRDLERV